MTNKVKTPSDPAQEVGLPDSNTSGLAQKEVKEAEAVEVKASKAKKSERDVAVSEGKRVFVEKATDVPEFQPVFAPQAEAKTVNVRALQHGDAD